MRVFNHSLALAASLIALSGCGLSQSSPKQEAQVTLRVAEAALSSGAPDLALHVADAVLEKKPTDTAAVLVRAEALYAIGRVDEARAAYRRAATLAPSSAAAQIGLGRTLVRTDPQAAEAAFVAALAAQPDDPVALNNLGIARDMQGRHWDAQAAYHQALAAAPGNTDVQTNLDLSLSLSGQAAAATDRLPAIPPVAAVTPAPRRPVALAPAQQPTLDIHPAPVTVVRQDTLPPKPSTLVRQDTLPQKPATLVRQEALPPKPVVAAARSAQPADLSAATASLRQTAFGAPNGAAADLLDAGKPVVSIPQIDGDAGRPAARPLEARTVAEAASAAPDLGPAPSKAGQALADATPGAVVRPADNATLSPVAAPAAEATADATARGADAPPADPAPHAAEAAPAAAPDVAPAPAAARGKQAAKRPAPRPAEHLSDAGFVAQIGALNSDRAAQAEWQRLSNLMPDLFAGRTPLVQQTGINQRTFWRLRTGTFADLSSARDFCTRVRSAGSDCWTAPVVRD